MNNVMMEMMILMMDAIFVYFLVNLIVKIVLMEYAKNVGMDFNCKFQHKIAIQYVVIS